MINKSQFCFFKVILGLSFAFIVFLGTFSLRFGLALSSLIFLPKLLKLLGSLGGGRVILFLLILCYD
jgi:hypothetical protein